MDQLKDVPPFPFFPFLLATFTHILLLVFDDTICRSSLTPSFMVRCGFSLFESGNSWDLLIMLHVGSPVSLFYVVPYFWVLSLFHLIFYPRVLFLDFLHFMIPCSFLGVYDPLPHIHQPVNFPMCSTTYFLAYFLFP